MAREFRVFDGLNWPPAICAAWQELTDGDPHASYVQTCNWNRACMEQLGRPGSAAVLVTVWRGNNLEAVFPFTGDVLRFAGFRLRVLRLPQHLHINLNGVALRPEVSHHGLIADLFGFLNTHKTYACDVIDFGDVTEESAIHGLLVNTPGARSTLKRKRVSSYLPVMSEDRLRKHVSKNMRGSLRAAQRKLDDHADVRYLSTRDPDVLPGFFERFLAVEASGWKGEEGTRTAILLDEKLVRFYRQLFDTFGRGGKCEINLLETDGRVAAAQFALIAGQTLYLLKIGYDQELAEISPGNLLLAHTLTRLHAQGEVAHLNLITDVDWHSRWRPRQLVVYGARCYGSTPGGTLAYLYQRIRAELATWRRSLQARVDRRSA
jgi:CelD/BcsL family acetyltransferase involved in cellulose biosynthesis